MTDYRTTSKNWRNAFLYTFASLVIVFGCLLWMMKISESNSESAASARSAREATLQSDLGRLTAIFNARDTQRKADSTKARFKQDSLQVKIRGLLAKLTPTKILLPQVSPEIGLEIVLRDSVIHADSLLAENLRQDRDSASAAFSEEIGMLRAKVLILDSAHISDFKTIEALHVDVAKQENLKRKWKGAAVASGVLNVLLIVVIAL